MSRSIKRQIWFRAWKNRESQRLTHTKRRRLEREPFEDEALLPTKVWQTVNPWDVCDYRWLVDKRYHWPSIEKARRK